MKALIRVLQFNFSKQVSRQVHLQYQNTLYVYRWGHKSQDRNRQDFSRRAHISKQDRKEVLLEHFSPQLLFNKHDLNSIPWEAGKYCAEQKYKRKANWNVTSGHKHQLFAFPPEHPSFYHYLQNSSIFTNSTQLMFRSHPWIKLSHL